MHDLEVDFLDELYRVAAGAELTFGRTGDLVVDDNPYMHRVVGTIRSADGLWWLFNVGRRISLEVVGSTGKRSELPPGGAEALTDERHLVRFEAGVTSYELAVRQAGVAAPPVTDVDAEATATQDFGVVRLNDEQREMLVVMAEARLRDPTGPRSEPPPNAEVAARLGWSSRKLDRKLDYLCRRLSERGVPGLRGGPGVEAFHRRHHLVEHALRAGMITAGDLALLDDR